MTVEEALAAPGRKVQTSWDGDDGQKVVTIYSVGSDGAKQIGGTTVPASEHDALVAQLTERGCERGGSEFLTRIVWVVGSDGVEVWDKRRKQLEAAGDSATLKEGRVVKRADLSQVFSWASDDYAHRGIKGALRSGEEVELVTEISLAATGDPTYGRNELLFESGWCTTLGRAIASWAGTGFEDRI